jgi:hypothetical protein
MSDPEETPAAEQEPDGSQEQQEVAETPAEVDATTEGGESQEQTPDQFDWTKFENADRYHGRTVQDLINYANQRDYQYGLQSNELGEARKYKAELEALRAQVSGQKPTEVKPKFSEVEQAMFLQKLQENPLSAVNEHLTPKLAETLENQIYEKVTKRLGPALQSHAHDVAEQQEVDRVFRDYPELNTDDDLLWATKRLMQSDYIGENARYEEAVLLAKMGKSEKSLFPVTCSLMRMGVPFKEAKEYATLKKNAAATAKTAKDQIKEEVSSISGATKRTSKKAGTKEPEIKDMDDAFDMD